MNRRAGVTLSELAVVAFLAGILSYLIFTMVFPVLRNSSQILTLAGVSESLSGYLGNLEQDIRASVSPGFNFASDRKDWTLALVTREWPQADKSTAWSTSVVVYHYDDSSHTLIRAILPSPTWSNGDPKLDGSEPPPLAPMPLASLAKLTPKTRIRFITCDPWPDPKKPLHIVVQPPVSESSKSNTVEALRDYGIFLKT